MDGLVYLTGTRMVGLTDQLQVIATNLANANTAGFKGTTGRFSAAVAVAGPQYLGDTSQGGMAPTWPEFSGLRVDLSQGPIRKTDRPLDLAISGKAFFVVETPEGPRYTRKGRFHLSATGEVTDGAGNALGTESGALRIPAGTNEIVIGRDGQVSAGERGVGRIRLVDIPEPAALVSQGEVSFRNDGPEAVPAAGSEVIQGAVEESNVNSVREMISLITVLRAYEAEAHIARRVDSSHNELIKSA